MEKRITLEEVMNRTQERRISLDEVLARQAPLPAQAAAPSEPETAPGPLLTPEEMMTPPPVEGSRFGRPQSVFNESAGLQAKQLPTDERYVLSPKFIQTLESRLNAMPSQAREAALKSMVSRKDAYGRAARDIQGRYQALGQISVPEVKKRFDPRLEQQVSRLVTEGDMDPQAAEFFAKRDIRMGQIPQLLPIARPDEAAELAEAERQRVSQEMEDSGFIDQVGAIAASRARQTGVGLAQMYADMAGDDELATRLRGFRQIEKGREAGIPDADSIFGRSAQQAIATLAGQGPMIVLGALTGTMAPVLAQTAIESFGQAYGDARSAFKDPAEAATRASLMAAAEVTFARYGLGDQFKAIRGLVNRVPTKELSGYLTASLIKEIPAEQATTLSQILIDKLPEVGLNPNAGMKDVFEAAAETLRQTVIQTGSMNAGIYGASAAERGYSTRLLPAISQNAAFARAIETDASRAGPTEAALRARSLTEMGKLLYPEVQQEQPPAPPKKPAAPPKKPTAPPAPSTGRVEPTVSLGEQIPAEPGGRIEPTMGPVVRAVQPVEEDDVVPGMVTEEDIEQGPLTPVNVEEEPVEPTAPVTPTEPAKPAALPFTPPGKGPQFKGSVAPTQAAARLPETPTVAPITKTKTFEPTPDQNMDLDLPIVNLPVKDLKLSQDVPQFKYGANKKGVVKPLGGKFTTEAVAPIAVWQRNDGSLEVISGRHRLDLAQRSGTEFIPSQIYYENQGFTAVDAAIKDAELNIRDDQGAVRDYVNYFKESGMERDTAESKGFLARDKGKRGFTIANQGSDELIDALRADQIGDEAAFYIALNAPNDSRLQAVGIKAILDGKSANFATNMMQAVKAMASENDTTLDMFGYDDSGTKEAEEMAKIAQRKQREIQTRLSAITGAAKNPALAKSEGIDIKDPEAVKRRIDELRQLKTAWDNFSTNPELIAEIRAERGVAAPTFELTSESEADRRAREEKEAEAKRIEAEKEKEAERKAKADKERDEFTLTGSDREADEAAARGQEDLFAAPAEPKTGDIVLSTKTTDGMEVRTFKTTDGYGTGLYDTDSGNFVNGSIVRYKGDDARKKAEDLHNQYVDESTRIDDEKLQPYARTPEYKKAQEEFIRAADRLNKARGTQQEPAAQAEYDKAAQELQFLKYEYDMRDEPRVRKILQRYLDQNKEVARQFKKWLEGRQKIGDVVNGKKPAADLPAKNRLVLMPCCDTKGPTKAPAMELYKGVFFQTFAGNVQDGAEPNVVILSAKHGFISPTAEIEPYDQVMDKARADEMLANLQAQMKGGDFPKNIKDVLIVGGKEYQRVMRAAIAALQDEGIISQDATINATSGGIGEQRKQLGEYLRSIKAPEQKTEFEPNESGFIGASDKEVADISKAFNAAKSAQDGESITRVFNPPKKSEIVRAEDKTKVFVKGEGYLTVAQAKKRIEEWKRNAEQQGDTGKNSEKIVLSLFDLTGEWSKPWEDAGYQVYRFDIQTDPEFGDVNKFSAEFFNDLYGAFEGQDVYAILAACPCTDFASSGSKHWAAKDEDGSTVESVELVKQTLATIEFFKPSIWAIENPVGRIEKLTGLPPWRLSFNPNHFGDPYTKKTLIWGRFNADLPIAPVEPTEGSKMHTKFGGKSQKTKNARSVTPEGFAYAFFQANNAVDNPLMAVANKYDMMDPEVFKGALAAGMTEQQISEVIDDPYYFSLDYEAAENALREAYSRPYTQAQREEAQTHADQVGGEIVWQKGEHALIRGYSMASGDPVYVPTIGSGRAKVDIESFTGNQIPDGVRKEMVAAKQEAERAAEEKHKRDPFVVFDNGVAISSDIPQDLAGVIREWKDLLKLDVPIFVGTVDFAKENRNKFTGPHRRIGSGTLDPNERGSMRRMSDGSYYILFKPSTSRTLMLETIAHEMGHVHERLVFNNATPEEKKALTDAHQKWVESQRGKSAKELVESLRGRSVGRATKASTTTSAAELSSYWRSFGEWYADQVSRWAMSSARPVSIVEKYFKRLAIQLRRFYQQLRARKYLPDETFEKYIEKVTSRPADIGPDTSVGEESSQMVSSVGQAGWTERRIKRLVNEFGYTDGRTYGIAAFVNPADFVRATTPDQKAVEYIREGAGPLDLKELSEETQTPFLDIDMEKGAIIGHEGRHRMQAMADAGITRAAVVIWARDRYGSKRPAQYEPMDMMGVSGQKFDGGRGQSLSLSNLIPLEYRQEERLLEEFGGPSSTILYNIDPTKFRTGLGFYSALAAGIDGLKMASAPAQGWKDAIKGLVNKGQIKAEEVEWSGINDWLDLQQGKVTKDQVAQYLQQGGVQVEETVLGDEPIKGNGWEEAGGGAKYANYTLPGGTNYREVLLTLPKSAEVARLERERDELNATSSRDPRYVALTDKIRGAQYRSSHWDQSNVIAHIRVNDRTDADGKKVLFVEEIQSDWGQEGKKRGFVDSEARSQIESEIRSLGINKPIENVSLGNLIDAGASQDLRDRFDSEMLRGASRPPAAPFVTKTEGWLNLALKRIMIMAAEGGYDRVAFVNGDQAAERFDLSKQVESISYRDNGDGTYKIVAAAVDRGVAIPEQTIARDDLPNVVGKEIADKIISGEGKPFPKGSISEDMKKLSGLDLKIGGEGMKTFYDKIIPLTLKKLLPKVGGGQIQMVEMENARSRLLKQYREAAVGSPEQAEAGRQLYEMSREGGSAAANQPGFDITPAMLEKVAAGVPLFSIDQKAKPRIDEFGYSETGEDMLFAGSSIRDDQIKEYARLRSMLGRLPKAVAEGKASIDMQRNVTDLMQRSRELQAAINKSKPRLDSAEQFLAKALTEYDKGNISKDVLDVIQTAYAKQPELLEGLLLSVRTPKIAGRAAGQFDTYDRIITLFKTSSGVESPTTIRHELTHTLEQMMTPEQRKLVVQAWGNALMKAIKQNPDDAHQRYFHAVLNFLERPSPKNHKAALDLLPSYDMYQFVNPSEFWAVNAEKLMAAQLGTPWSKFKRAVRRMWEAIKKVLGFDNRSDVHKVFAQVMGGSLERTTRASLVELVSAQGADSVRLQNIDDDKDLLRTYGRPNTPMLDKTPIRTAVTKTAAEAKQVFKETVKNPVGMAKSANNALVDGILAARIKTSWYAAGVEARDFARYGGALRDSQGIVIASVAVDNAIRSGNIGAQVIFRGGLKFDKKLGNFVAVDTKLGMKGVYMAEAALKKKLGEQLGTDIIQSYLEAKRSISIMKELFNREANVESAKDNLKAMRDMGASPDDIAQAKEALAQAKRDLEAIEKAASSVNMTEDEMQDFAALEDKHPELRDLMDNWTAVNQNLLRVWRQVGLLSQARYDTLAAIEDYVPWYRIMRDDEDLHSPDQAAVQSTTRSLTNIGVERKFKRGQPRAVFDFRAKEGQKDFKIQPSSIVRAQVNGQPVPQDLISVKPNGEVRIDVDLKDNDFVVFETNREIQNIIDNMTRNVMRMTMNGIRQFAANRIVSEYGSRNEKGKLMVFPSPDPDKGRFNWIANGRKVVVEIQDPLVAEAIYGMDNLNLKMWAPLAAAANLVRRSITLSGAFQVKQVFKDAPTAAMVTGVKNPFALIGGVWKGFLTSLIQPVGKKVGVDVEPVVEILRAAGIGGFHSPARTPEAEVKRRIGVMNGNIFSAVIQTLDHIGDSSDMAQRVAVYKRVLAETGDETQALYQAANVINFLHHGSAGFAQAAVKVVPFLGAYANSTDVLVNSLMGGGLKGMSRKRALARLAFTTSMLSLTTLLYCMLAGGDPEYDELDDQTKLRNIIIPGTKIVLPMNTSASFIFKAIPELIYNAITREGTENEMDARRLRRALAEVARDSLLGPEPVPAGIKPLFEVAINHSFFTGRAIIPEGLKDVEAAEQYTATTSELGKKLSEYLAIPGTDKRVLNPIEADHIIRGLFGTAGAMAQWASNSIGAASEIRPEQTPREQPVTGGFLREEVPRGNEDLFYDFRDAVRKKHETWKKMVDREDFDKADAYLEEHGDVAGMYQYINETEAELKEINSAIRRLGESKDKDLKPKERREEITEFQRLKQEILSPVKELRREVLK